MPEIVRLSAEAPAGAYSPLLCMYNSVLEILLVAFSSPHIFADSGTFISILTPYRGHILAYTVRHCADFDFVHMRFKISTIRTKIL